MASHTIASNRERYHSGQTSVGSWLVATAGRFTDVRAILQANCNPGPPRRRKALLGERHHERSLGLTFEHSRQMFALINEIRRRFLDSPLEPQGLRDTIRILQDCIRLRRDSAAHFQLAGNRNVTVQESNRRHQWFIRTLTRILEALESLRKSPPPKALMDSESGTSALLQGFRALEVEEPSAHLEAPSKSPHIPIQPGVTSSVSISVHLQDDPYEADLALSAVFTELNELRTAVRGHWTEYRDNKLTLDCAARNTESAIELFVDFVNNTFDYLPAYREFANVARLLDLEIVMKDGELERVNSNDIGAIIAEDLNTSVPNAFCAYVWTLLSLLKRFTESKGASELKTQLRAIHPFGCTLLNIWPDIEALDQRYQEGYGAFDETMDWFTGSMIDFIEMPIDIAMVAVVQCQCDIADIMESFHAQPFLQLLSEAKRASKTFFEFSSFLGAEGASRMFPELERIVQMATGAPLEDLSAEQAKTNYDPLTRNLPVIAGMHMDRIVQYMHSRTIEICNDGLVPLAVSHIYSTVRQTRHLTKPWTDMDDMINLQGGSQLGIRNIIDSSTPRLLAARNFGWVLGAERPKGKKLRMQGKTFMSREPLPQDAAIQGAVMHITSTSGEMKLKCETSDPNDARIPTMPILLHQVAKDLLVSRQHVLNDSPLAQLEGNFTLDHTQMMEVLLRSMKSEQASIRFDYARLFQTCWKIMCRIREECAIALKAAGREEIGGFAKGAEDYHFVDEILWSAAEREREMLDDGSGKIQQPDLLKICAKVLLSVAESSDTPLLEDARRSISRPIAPIRNAAQTLDSKRKRAEVTAAKGLGLVLKADNLKLTGGATKTRQRIPPTPYQPKLLPKPDGTWW